MIKIQITHEAADDVGKLAFIVHIRDNYSTEAKGATTESDSTRCTATLEFNIFNDAVTAIQDFKQNFDAKWRMNFEP